jgi:hypothetical protein
MIRQREIDEVFYEFRGNWIMQEQILASDRSDFFNTLFEIFIKIKILI